MCGIVGFIEKDGCRIGRIGLQSALNAADHRGPDSRGVYEWRNVHLGHTRLRIIDLDAQSDQPFCSDDESLILTYNGEIYNYIELREELIAAGCRFATSSDTEVLLQAYSTWGTSCVQRFNGMWAFAILDKRRNTLFCSRDRFGIKPFYFIDSPDAFAFGSEQKQLVDFLDKREANIAVVVDFLLTQIADSDEHTFFKAIQRLLPGHNLLYDLRDNAYSIERYYEIKRDEDAADLSPDEATARFNALLESSVSLRLRSDVRVGTCLSGGLDSSSVATIAADLHHGTRGEMQFAAVTAVSTQRENDETPYAQLIVENSDLSWIKVKPGYEDFSGVLERLAYTQDEPYGGPSIAMQFFVMRSAREHGITVLLDGQGGDEVLLGYEKYYPAAIAAMYRDKGSLATCRMLRDIIANNDSMSLTRIGKYFFGIMSVTARYLFYARRHRYLKDLPGIPSHLEAFAASAHDPEALQRLECTSTNLPILLRYEDKNSMAHSIEARLPFLDYRLLEYALSLPINLKIRGGWTKWLLRMNMRNRMPDSIVWRRNKKGFEAPEDQWLARHYQVMLAKVLSSPLINRIVKPNSLKKVYPRLDKRSQWRLYSTALWEQTFSITE